MSAFVLIAIMFIGVIIGMFKVCSRKKKLSRDIILSVFLGMIVISILIVALCCL